MTADLIIDFTPEKTKGVHQFDIEDQAGGKVGFINQHSDELYAAHIFDGVSVYADTLDEFKLKLRQNMPLVRYRKKQ